MVFSDDFLHFLKIKIFFYRIHQNYLVALTSAAHSNRKVWWDSLHLQWGEMAQEDTVLPEPISRSAGSCCSVRADLELISTMDSNLISGEGVVPLVVKASFFHENEPATNKPIKSVMKQFVRPIQPNNKLTWRTSKERKN